MEKKGEKEKKRKKNEPIPSLLSNLFVQNECFSLPIFLLYCNMYNFISV